MLLSLFFAFILFCADVVVQAWEFMKKNWDLFVKKFGGSFAMSRVVTLAGYFSTVTDADDVKQFFATHPAPAGERAVKQTIEK